MPRSYVHGYAVMRIRLDALRTAGSITSNENELGAWLYNAVVPVRIFTSRDAAIDDAKRLTESDAPRGVYYFVQETRIIVSHPAAKTS